MQRERRLTQGSTLTREHANMLMSYVVLIKVPDKHTEISCYCKCFGCAPAQTGSIWTGDPCRSVTQKPKTSRLAENQDGCSEFLDWWNHGTDVTVNSVRRFDKMFPDKQGERASELPTPPRDPSPAFRTSDEWARTCLPQQPVRNFWSNFGNESKICVFCSFVLKNLHICHFLFLSCWSFAAVCI